jgi:hypothetical protein
VGTIKNAVLWDVTPCGSCKNRRFGGTCRFHYQGDENWRAGKFSSNYQPKHAVQTTSPHIPEDGILHVQNNVLNSPPSYISNIKWRSTDTLH